MDLIKEVFSIIRITQNSHKSSEELARSFSEMMIEGKVKKSNEIAFFQNRNENTPTFIN
jgi:hypothetical protein